MKMMTVITHVLALGVGGMLGVLAMCLFQAGKR